MIVDQYGNPFSKSDMSAAIDEPQSSKLVHLYREFESHPSRGLTPAKLAGILEGAEQGDMIAQTELFEDMEEKDAHIFAEMAKRASAPLTREWSIEPPRNASSKEKSQAEEVAEWFEDIELEELILFLSRGVGYGFSNIEIEWQQVGGVFMPQFHARPASWFTVAQDDRDTPRLRDHTIDGAELIPFGWLAHRHRAKNGYLARSGIHRVLAWPYLYKNYSVRDLAEFLEIYGLPMRLGKYHRGATDVEKATLMRAVMGIGHSAAGIIPESMSIDFQNAANGTQVPYEAMIDWCERSQSKAILGQTLTTEVGSSGGNRALGEVHERVLDAIVKSDARQYARTITRDLIYPMQVLNGHVAEPSQGARFVYDLTDDADLAAQAEIDTKIYELGYEPSENYIQETYGEGWAKRVDPQPSAAMVASLKGKVEPTRETPVDDYAEQLGDEMQDPLKKMINRLKDVIEGADSYESAIEAIDQLQEEFDPEAVALVMADAFAASVLSGRFEADADVLD